MKRLATMIGTVMGVGYLRPAPGTWGSLVALPMAWLIHLIGGFPLLIVAVIATFIKGLWATDIMTRDAEDAKDPKDHDPSEIVIDEVLGQFIALLPLSYAAWSKGLDITVLWPGWVAAFALFRLFDITKPGPIGWADRRKGPMGVMLDDVIAGVFAAIGVIILAGLWHGVLAR